MALVAHGTGMGHAMVMPGVFVAWGIERLRLAASVGYSRALGVASGHDHGAWPLVSPMLMSEVSWTAGADVRVAPAINAGLRSSGRRGLSHAELLMRLISVALWFAVACGPTPTDTETTCPDPDPGATWDSFGKPFMAKYCTWCHDSSLPRSKRNGAPLYHDFDALLGVLKTPDHIDQQAGSGPAATNEIMPPDRCPSVIGGKIDGNCMKPTLEERKQLAEWIACERARPHEFFDAGVDAEVDAP